MYYREYITLIMHIIYANVQDHVMYVESLYHKNFVGIETTFRVRVLTTYTNQIRRGTVRSKPFR